MTHEPRPRLLLARFSPWRTTAKRELAVACLETGLPARPNWHHASHEVFLDSIADLAERTGVEVAGRLDLGHREGRHNRYQTVAAWSVRATGARPGSISWNTDTGRVGGTIRGAAYRAFVEGIPAAVERAERTSTIDRSNLHDQVAVSIMTHLPAAPFCRPEHVGPGLWILAQDSPELNAVRRFMQLINLPLLSLSETEASPVAYRTLIRQSLAAADSRFGVRVGWLDIARRSHAELAKAVDSVATR